MAVEEFASRDEDWYMIMQFDPRNAELIKVGDSYASSEFNIAEARRDARLYAERAAAKGLPLQYLVVQAKVDVAFRPSE
jgi:hypothetical protein